MVIDHRFTDSTSLLDHRLTELPAVITEYLLTCKLDSKSKYTLISYKDRLTIFYWFLKNNNLDLSIDRITVQTVRLFLGYLTDKNMRRGGKMSPVTVNGYYRCLHKFFNWVTAEGYIDKNHYPMANINPPKIPKRKPMPFSQQDLDNLMLLCEGDSYMQVRSKAIVLIAYDTGLRLSELSAIKMQDFSLDTGLIKVIGKGNKERTVRICVKTRKALLRYLRYRDTKFEELWQTEERTPLSRDGVQITIRRLCHRAEITDAVPGAHTFRHTCAFSSLKAGAGIYDLKELFGHEDIRTTQRYLNAYNSEIACENHVKFSPVQNMKGV